MALTGRSIVYRGTFLNRHPAPGCRRCAGGAYRVGIASTTDCNKYCILVADFGLLHWLLVAAMLAWWMARGRKPGAMYFGTTCSASALRGAVSQPSLRPGSKWLRSSVLTRIKSEDGRSWSR